MERAKTVSIVAQNRGRGSGKVVQYHAQKLCEAGFNVNLLCPHEIHISHSNYRWIPVDLKGKPTPVHEYLPHEEHQVTACSLTYTEAREYVSDYKRTIGQISEETDIFYSHHANLSSIATAEVAREVGKPNIMFVYGTGIEGYIKSERKDRLWGELVQSLTDADKILVLSKYVKHCLLKPWLSSGTLRKVAVIPGYIDEHLVDTSDAAISAPLYFNGLPYILYIGALIESKGARLLAIASHLYGHLATTVFIGDGPLQDEINQVGKNCITLGYVDDQTKKTLLEKAVLVVVPSLKIEHFGLTVLEAMACGTAPIAFNQGGPREIIEDQKTGFLVPYHNALNFGLYTAQLLEHPEVLKNAGNSAKTYALKLHLLTSSPKFIASVIDI